MRRTIAAFAVLILFSGHSVRAEESLKPEPLPPELGSLNQAYEREKNRVLSPVEQKYTKALKELKGRFAQSGQLQNALSVDVVISSRMPKTEKVQGEESPFPDDAPPELRSLSQVYEREKARVIAPVEMTYTEALEALKDRFTKSGQLKNALAVEGILASRMPKTEEVDSFPKDTRWKWGSGGILTLNGDGTAMHSSWLEEGVWRRMGNGSLKLTYRKGEQRIEFQDGENGIVGAWKGNGKSTTLTLME